MLAPYLAAYLYRKHGENIEAQRWLKALEKKEGENSVVDDAAGKMRESIALEQIFQELALESYLGTLKKGDLEGRAAAEITYVVAELYRRTGNTKSAIEWYQKAIDTPGGSAALRDLATRQRTKIAPK